MSKSQISLLLKWAIAEVMIKQIYIYIYIENQILKTKDTAKYLYIDIGIYIDKQLSWDRHIEHINSKLNRDIGILRKPRSYPHQDSLRTICNSFLKPY